jgi:hypothetical protein
VPGGIRCPRWRLCGGDRPIYYRSRKILIYIALSAFEGARVVAFETGWKFRATFEICTFPAFPAGTPPYLGPRWPVKDFQWWILFSLNGRRGGKPSLQARQASEPRDRIRPMRGFTLLCLASAVLCPSRCKPPALASTIRIRTDGIRHPALKSADSLDFTHALFVFSLPEWSVRHSGLIKNSTRSRKPFRFTSIE